MSYYFSKNLPLSHSEAIEKVTAALKNSGFGIVSEIQMHEKFKEKLNVDFKKYTILGACNPGYALKAVQNEEKIGTMLPCNVVIIEKGENVTEIAAVNPVASMMAVNNQALEPIAREITQILKEVIENL
ncbi:MAG TPA: DUF302 domain-containing protein [Bacteroidales bacterium]|nr:DUF302 domain-containing protein [Bacteroidales bacterium]